MFGAPLEAVLVFVAAIVTLLGLDLYFVGRNSHKISMKEAGFWTGVFIAVSLMFAGFVHYDMGAQKSLEFLNAYAIEKILSVDNLFVFILVFSYFKVKDEFQHKVLFWGVLGAIIMRLIFIYLGVEVINKLDVNILGHDINVLIVAFGAFLAFTGIKSLFSSDDDEEADFSDSMGVKVMKKLYPRFTDEYDGDKFFTIKNGVKFATPLLLVVGVIEFTDLLFAVDSIPAIFSVSDDPFILYTSNIFAILGLRSMYFLLSGLLPMFKYLGTGVSVVLAFIGVKMLATPFYHMDSTISLIVILSILVVSVTASLLSNKSNE